MNERVKKKANNTPAIIFKIIMFLFTFDSISAESFDKAETASSHPLVT